ncbi:MAG: pilus assembly PilX N-terminal domain-containing protein [Rickettsiales bacterium]|nr:pilus assembly PilX N-terminal domain-containing protein [Rickettsiales bacterium]
MKTKLLNKNSESGNILVASLLLMLAMNFLAITLVQSSVRENNIANFKEAESSSFYLAESCVDEVVTWFKGFTRPPTAIPYVITKANISHLYSGSESTSSLGRLAKYSYNCSTTALTIKSTSADRQNIGEDISSSDGYGLSGDLRPKYFYQVSATAYGPNNTEKKLRNILSVEY